MSEIENNVLKEELVEWIESINDDHFLNALKNNEQSKDRDWWDDLSDEARANINLGLSDLKEGRVVDSTTFWQAVAGQ